MKNIILTLFISISCITYSQNLDYNNSYESINICTAIQGNNFASERAADSALDDILNVIGASKRFVLQECSNINNAVALTMNGVRYIMYDPEFMVSLSYGDEWSNKFILAHEVGHHINGHTVDVLASNSSNRISLSTSRIQELEADEFAGFVLGRLGASLSEALSGVQSISDKDDSYSTHPRRSKRITAIKKGFNESGGYVESSNLDIKKGKTIDSPYSNSRYTGVEYQTRNDLYNNGIYEGYISVNTNRPFGYGTFFGNNGLKYEGEWADGLYNGYGKLTHTDGQTYEGFFVNDLMSGEGVVTLSNGDKWVGFFSKDVFIRGTIYEVGGIVISGIFRNNIFIECEVKTSEGETFNLGFLDGSKGNGYTTYITVTQEIKGLFKDGILVPQIGMGYGEYGTLALEYQKKSLYKNKKIGGVADFIPVDVLNIYGDGEKVKSKRLKVKEGYTSMLGFEKTLSYVEILYKNVNETYKGYVLSETFQKFGYGEYYLDEGISYKGMFWNDIINGYGLFSNSYEEKKVLFKNGELLREVDFDFDWMQRTMKRW